ncbi:hypothetical protein BAUCODRAFT_562997 [Baudoinia panamericana UAMH 10762]|uniref:RING-type domain-containing protein n=1 Tax=Baudoinia panamericana (strain UAMH 10762) TaxID=717646 RepID=M2N7N9_BAUPA|nr:uncharacterized protein BAUCODRAFT_562997 [Baudoinia panamericana UAMH 10762]EMC94820.1 hypothetical protein BAUCODRAFT_562997 [Baudoinia panamericana UAMH 10762]
MEGEAEVTGHQSRSAHSVALNARYVASCVAYGILIQSLDNPNGSGWYLDDGRHYAGACRTLALSALRPIFLAVSDAGRARIYDVDIKDCRYTLAGNGRTITALSWSSTDGDLLAAGTIDGCISLWKLGNPVTQVWQTCAPRTRCTSIAFNALSRHVFASSHAGDVEIWSAAPFKCPIKRLALASACVTALDWNLSVAGRLLTVSDDAIIRIWDVAAMADGNLSDGDDLFGGPEALQQSPHPIAKISLDAEPVTAAWLGEYGFYALLHGGDEVRLYSLGADWEMLHEVWRLRLRTNALAITLRITQGATRLTVASTRASESHRIPTAVLDSVGGHNVPDSTYVHNVGDKSVFGGAAGSTSTRAMKPMKVSWRISAGMLIAQPGSPGQTSHRRHDSGETARKFGRSKPGSPTALISDGFKSISQLPKTRANMDEAAMPFLSPTVPARKPSPGTILPRIEDMALSTLGPSVLTLVEIQDGNASDSDDETYAGGMRASGGFMAGGGNVPRPRACGAIFAPNGQLVMFGRRKTRPCTAVKRAGLPTHLARNPAQRVARLFPGFGNLHAIAEDGSEDGALGDLHVHVTNGSPATRIAKTAKSVRQTVHFQGSYPDAHNHGAEQAFISVLATDAWVASSMQTTVAYHILRQGSDTGSSVCAYNAEIADLARQADTADIWRLLGMLVDTKVPLQTPKDTSTESNVLVVARRVTSLLHGDVDSAPTQAHSNSHRGMLRWADGPLGPQWLVRQCLGWAEQSADTVLLAVLSSVLVQSVHLGTMTAPQQAMRKTFPICDADYASQPHYVDAVIATNRLVPLLRTDSEPNSVVHISPTKLRYPSLASSRNVSQPSTPHPDSGINTPPLAFPPLAKNSTRLSATNSGSTSPEYHRSSFSAAARHYAQSITDKFASYGVSPPTKMSGTSPSTHELSSSLPTVANLWSKSVSFASATSTSRDSQLSNSHSAHEEEGYDTDKTIEDSSLPQTPRSVRGPVSVTLCNNDLFSDEVSGKVKHQLLPDDLLPSTVLWVRHHAEQLRCWGLNQKAAEFEKVLGITHPASVANPAHLGMQLAPQPRSSRVTCSICYTVIPRLQQACSRCLHATHLHCLEDYLSSLDGGEDFECPSGCGCRCSHLPFELLEVITREQTSVETVPKVMRKKPSFTDPRRWRARVEGDSW